MPGPLDLLKRGYNFATTPLVDEESIRPAQDMIDPGPSMDRSPMEARMRGFGAGALEGMRGLTTPLDLAAVAMPMAGRAISGLKGMMGAGRAAQAAGPTMDIIEQNPIKQVAGSMGDVESLIGDMRRNMARVPQAGSKMAPMAETLGERAAEFTPAGGEAMYNIGKGAGQPGAGMDGMYDLLMKRFGGRGGY